MTEENFPRRRVARGHDVDEICGISKSTRYRLEAAGQFPKRVILTQRSSGYFLDEVEAWLASRPRANAA